MSNMFSDPTFKKLWQQALDINPGITLTDFILNIHGIEPQPQPEKLKVKREDVIPSDKEYRQLPVKTRKNISLIKPRSGCHVHFKIQGSENSYLNSERRRVTNSLTNISLC